MWWIYIVASALLAFGIYAFISVTGVATRRMSSKSARTVESIYDKYADSP
jgi:hypothetical protein